jgi:hypothetical protein
VGNPTDMTGPNDLPDDSAGAFDTTGPTPPAPGAEPSAEEVPESIEDDPGEGLFLDDEPLTADDAPPPESGSAGPTFAEQLDVRPDGDIKG